MKIVNLPLEGLLLFIPKVFVDSRGYFFESFNSQISETIKREFVQDNESFSSKNVLRGLHFQVPSMEQGKLIRVIKGQIWDVAVDIRKNSPTFGKFHIEILSGDNKHIFWIPPGFAHGFLVLQPDTIISYKVTAPYSKNHERCLFWDDKEIGIPWPFKTPIISEKDAKGLFLKDLDILF